jgi:Domain of unknown function (DUF4345)
MAASFLRFGLWSLGLTAMAISISIMVFGAGPVASFFEGVLTIIAGPSSETKEVWSRNTDSELRFYAVFFAAYGVMLCRAGADLSGHWRMIPFLLGLFFLGGAGRALSCWQLGPPGRLFIVLMAIELLFPVLFFLLWKLHLSAGKLKR